MTLLEHARALYDAGLNILPALKKQKRPVGKWKNYVETRPAFSDAFPTGVQFDALCVVCGKTSGGLEILDFDQKAVAFDDWSRRLSPTCSDLLNSLPVETTQSGGRHIAYRCETYEGNKKLANDPNGVTIETRGEGGICLIAPSPGYEIIWGDWTYVPTITKEQRSELWDAARACDKTPRKEAAPKSVPSTRSSFLPARSTSLGTCDAGESASEYFRRVNAGRDALIRAGWEYLRDEGDWEHWKRPDQPVEDKPGGSWSKSDGYFHCFTSNAAPLEAGRSYSHFQIVATLEFNGDLSAAARAVARPIGIPRPAKNAVVELLDPSELEADGEFLAPVPPDPSESKKTAPASRIVPFPKELYHVDGILGEIAEMMNKLAIRPQPEGAFLGALACVSYLCGRSVALNYNGTLVTPNIYALFLAPTGMGKEAIRRVSSEIARAYAPERPTPESFASVQALQNFVAKNRKVLWLHDEFGRDLKIMTGENNNANLKSVITESLKLYSNANNRAYLPKIVSDEAQNKKAIEPVDRPALTIFATGNPSEYYDATSDALLKNGYIARFTTILGRKYSEKKELSYEQATNVAPFALSERFLQRVEDWRRLEKEAEENPFLVPFTRAAFEIVQEFDAQIEKLIKLDAATRETLAGARARYFEKIWKYALAFAASRYGASPQMIVDVDCARWATLLVDYESQVFSATADRYAANNATRLAIDVREWAAEIGGTFSQTEFTRKFQRRGKLSERREVIETLLEAEYLGYDETTRRFFLK